MAKRKKVKSKAAVRSKGAPRELPSLQALVVCDGATRDPANLKWSLLGIFDRWNPVVIPFGVAFCVYAKLRGGSGRHSVWFDFVDPKGKQVGVTKPPTFDVDCTPDAAPDIVMIAAGLVIKSEGVYQIVARSGDKSLGGPCRIIVKRLGK